ncbi:class I SAM-dependent DNA methyltransferase [Lutibacter sp.]
MEHFDKKAENWDNDPLKVERAKIIAKEIKRYLNPNKNWTALEFGCGTGLLSYFLKDSFKSITLSDTSEGMITVLNEKIKNQSLKNFNPILANLLEKDTLHDTFNVIYTLMTLHHIVDLNKAAKRFASLLKDDGYLCIADLVAEDGSFHANQPQFVGHNGFDKAKLSQLLIDHGFKMVHYNICFTIEKEVNNTIKKYPLFLMVCKK